MRRSSSRAFASLLAARPVLEAVAFAFLLALVHMTGGREPLALNPTSLGIVGSTLIRVAALRVRRSDSRGTAGVGATRGAGLLLAVVLPTHPLDVVTWGGRIIAFVIVAEVYLWRVVSLARGAVRWTDARNAVPFGAVALALAAIAPVAVDRTPLVPLALFFVSASAVALSVARSAEELSLTTGPAGSARLSSANSVVFALGLAAIVAALAAPAVDQVLRDVGETLAPAWDEIIFTLLLPLGYLAALVYAILEPLLRRWSLSSPTPSASQRGDDLALLREIEKTRPLVVGGFEVVVVIVVILFQQFEMLHQFLPFLRLDGYYVIIDLTGVPEIFLRIKPTLLSLIPGRKADQKVTALKPWVRIVVTLWVLATATFILYAYGMMMLHLLHPAGKGRILTQQLGAPLGITLQESLLGGRERSLLEEDGIG